MLVLKYLVHRPYEFKVYSVSSFIFFFILTCIIFTTQTAASPSSIQSIILSFLDLSKEFVTFIHLLDIQQILFLLHFFIVFFFFSSFISVFIVLSLSKLFSFGVTAFSRGWNMECTI